MLATMARIARLVYLSFAAATTAATAQAGDAAAAARRPLLVTVDDLPVAGTLHSDAAERRRMISAAKVQIGRSGRYVGEQAIQLHGGIGMTMEYKVGHYFKRVRMIDTQFGDADFHLAAVANAGGLIDPI